MSSFGQPDPWLDPTNLDGLLSMSPQMNFNFEPRAQGFTGLATPPETEEPSDFIQKLANQNQVLACLRWLGEFQVLALIPRRSSISTSEVAELAGVPPLQLSRIVRMTATAGFLCEPQPGQIAHTTLSSKFASDFQFQDAIMFLAESAAPTALSMTTATERQGRQKDSTESAYSLAFNTPFQSACLEQPRLQRRYNAYVRYTGAASNGFIELLSRLNWRSLGSASVIDANAQSTEIASALLQWNSSLRVTIQTANKTSESGSLEDSDNRFTWQRRASAAVQTVRDGAVYILRLTDVSTLKQQLVAELNAHIGVLRSNGSATLIVEVPFVPESGSLDPSVEAAARLWDLCRSQLTTEGDLDVSDLEALINSVQDGSGKLVVVNKLRSRSSATMAIGIKYESGLGGLYSAMPLLS